MMTREEFRARWEALHPEGFDHKAAALFIDSGWTQEAIAAEVGYDQSYVSRLLRFGRFQREIMPLGINSLDLTERVFREHWDATGSGLDEAARFRAICAMLGLDLPSEPTPKPAASTEDNAITDEAIDTLLRSIGGGSSEQVLLHSKRSRKAASEVLKFGHERLHSMLRSHQLGLQNAAEFARTHSLDEQATATADDVRAMKAKRKAQAAPTTAKKLKKPKKSKPTPPAAPPPAWRSTNIGALDVGDEPAPDGPLGQPIRLQPMATQRLQEASIRVTGIAGRVHGCATADVDQFRKDIDLMLAHVVQPGKRHYDRNYPKEATTKLAEIDREIDAAIHRLSALREAVRKQEVAA